MNESPKEQPAKVKRSDDFRYIPCDAVALATSDHSVKILFAVEEMDGEITELVGAHLPFKTAMQLKAALSQALTHYQNETGIELEEPDFSND